MPTTSVIIYDQNFTIIDKIAGPFEEDSTQSLICDSNEGMFKVIFFCLSFFSCVFLYSPESFHNFKKIKQTNKKDQVFNKFYFLFFFLESFPLKFFCFNYTGRQESTHYTRITSDR